MERINHLLLFLTLVVLLGVSIKVGAGYGFSVFIMLRNVPCILNVSRNFVLKALAL